MADGAAQSVTHSPSDGGNAAWRDRRVFVTGATGVIGSWLVRALVDRGAYVVALVRDADPQTELYRSGTIHNVAVTTGALEDFWTLERAISRHEIDTVFHLGAQALVGVAHRFPLGTFEANIRGTYNLLEACRIHSGLVARVVVASSDKAYGEVTELPYTEEMPPLGREPYSVSKSCTDLLASAYYHSYGLPVVIARCGNVYGGGDLNWSRLVPGTIRAFLKGEPPVLRSDGSFLRDYIYARDVADAYLAMADAIVEGDGIAGEAFNISHGSPLSVLELVEVIRRLMAIEGIEPEILDCAVGEIHDQYLSPAKASDRLGWTPIHSLEDGLAETIMWYREFFG